MCVFLQSEVVKLRTQLSTKEQQFKSTKQRVEKEKQAADDECGVLKSEVSRLKKEVQSMTEVQEQLQAKNKVGQHVHVHVYQQSLALFLDRNFEKSIRIFMRQSNHSLTRNRRVKR